jgi:hypothetical protein
MDKKDLIKGKWYFLSSGYYVKFDHVQGNGNIWVTEYIDSDSHYQSMSGNTSSGVVREASADDYQEHPEMGVYEGHSNYEIY